MNISEQQKQAIISLVLECGQIMLSAHEPEKEKDAVIEKDGAANLVTVYDVKVQNTLIDGLKRIVPDALFIAEEKDNSEADISSGFCFVIDPIDGTTNFIHDLKASAVSVGLFYKNEPVFSVVLDPYKNELFSASKGQGAFRNGEKIQVSDRSIEKALLAFGTCPYYKDTLADISFDIAKNIYMQISDMRRSGSAALDLCSVACGKTDIFFEAVLSPWDYAGGWLIVTEAGGRVSDFSNSINSFSKPSSVLCTNGKLHGQILDIIKKTEEKSNGR